MTCSDLALIYFYQYSKLNKGEALFFIMRYKMKFFCRYLLYCFFVFDFHVYSQDSCLELPSSVNSCLDCSYNYFRSPNMTRMDNIYKNNCSKREQNYFGEELNFFIGISKCEAGSPCNGSKEYPFDEINKALWKAHVQANEKIFSNINIYLLKGPHYVLRKNLPQVSFAYFRRVNCSIQIKPCFCRFANITGCLAESQPVEVHMKTDGFNIFIANSLLISDILFYGWDIHLAPTSEENNLTHCYNNESRCCLMEGLNSIFSLQNPCGLLNRTINITNLESWNYRFGFLNLEPILDDPKRLTPKITLLGILFAEIYTSKPAHSWVALIFFPSNVRGELEFYNVTVRNIQLIKGIIFSKALEYLNPPAKSVISLWEQNKFDIVKINLDSMLINQANNYNVTLMKYSLSEVAIFSFESFRGRFYLANSKISNCINAQPILGLFSLYETVSVHIYNVLFSSLDNVLVAYVVKSLVFFEKTNFTGIRFAVTGMNLTSNSEISFDNCIFELIIGAIPSKQYFIFCEAIVLQFNSTLIKSAQTSILSYSSNITIYIMTFSNFSLSNNFLRTYSNFLKIQNLYVNSVSVEKTFFQLNEGIFIIENLNLFNIKSNFPTNSYKDFLFYSVTTSKSCSISNFNIDSFSGSYDFLILNFLGSFTNSLISIVKITVKNSALFKMFKFIQIATIIVENLNIFSNSIVTLPEYTLMNATFFKYLTMNNLSAKNLYTGSSNCFLNIGFCLESNDCVLSLSNFNFTNVARANKDFINIKIPNTEVKNFSIYNFTYLENYSGGVSRLIYFNPARKLSIDSLSLVIFGDPLKCVFEMYDTEDVNITNILINNKLILENSKFYASVISSRGGSKFFLKSINLINLRGRSSEVGTNYKNGFINFFGLETDAVKFENDIQIISYNINFLNCGGWPNGVIGYSNINKITLSNLTFKNTSSIKGGGVHITRVTQVILKYFEFQTSMAESGGCLFLSDIQNLIMENIRVIGSFAKYEGGVFYMGNIEIGYFEEIFIDNCVAEVYGGAFYNYKANITINAISIANSFSKDEGGAIFQTLGNLNITEGSFSYLSSKSGGFASVQLSPLLHLKNIQVNFVNSTGKGASLSLFDVLDINIESSLIFKAAGKVTYGNIFIESLAENISCKISNFICFENDISLGSCLYYIAKGVVNINNSAFTSNKGNLLQIQPKNNTFFIIANSNFSFSKLQVDSLHYLAYFRKVKLVFEGVNQFSNTIADHLMAFESSNVTIRTVQIRSIFAVNSKSELLIFDFKASHADISKIEFLNELRKSKISFLRVKDCDFSIHELILSNCLTYSGLIAAQNSRGSIIESIFENNVGISSGAIYLISSNLSIINSVLRNNTLDNEFLNPEFPKIDATLSSNNLRAVDIFSESFFNFYTVLNISSCSFESFGKSIIAYKLKSVDIELSLLRGYLGSGVLAYSCNLSIKRTNFQNLKNTEGAAVTFYNFYLASKEICQLSIISSDFFNNTAEFGGAILVQGFVNSSIKSCNFINNRALATGGVLYLTCEQCSDLVLIVNNCTFLSNRAENFAPTIFSQALTLCGERNKFENNSDKISLTENFFSFPLRVAKRDIAHSDNDEKYEGFESQNIIISGRKFSLSIAVIDVFNQTVLFDDNSKSTLKKGKNEKNVQIIGGLGNSINGTHELKDVIVLSKPNSNISLDISIVLDERNILIGATEINTLNSLSYQLDFFSRPCIVGEVFIKANLSCLKCRPKEFSLIDPMLPGSDDTCKECPANAKCRGGSDISPVYGNWRAHSRSSKIIPCLGYDFCLGGEGEFLTVQEKINGKCLIHHSGTMCYTCEKGYARLGSKSRCEECRSSAFLIFKFIITILALFSYALIQVNLNFTSENKSGMGTLLKQILNHFQLLQMVSVMDMGWTPDILEYFRLQEYVSFLSEEMVSLDCIISNIDSDILVMRVVATNILPLILATLMIMTLFIKTQLSNQRKGGSNRKINFKLYFKSSTVVIAYQFLPEILKKSFSLLNCMQIDDSSNIEVVVLSPNIICWETAHLEYFYTVFLPGIVFWGVALPICSLVLLVLNRSAIQKSINFRKSKLNIKDFRCGKTFALSDKLWDQTNSPEIDSDILVHDKNVIKRRKLHFKVSQPPTSHSLDKPRPPKLPGGKKNESSAPTIMKFLYRGYKSKYFYWEFVIYLKKLFMIMISSYSGMVARESKSTLVLVVVSLFLLAQTRVRPFESPDLNNIEYFSLLVVFLTANVGIVLFSSNVKEHSTALLGILIFVNSAYLVYFLIILIKEISKFVWLKPKPKA